MTARLRWALPIVVAAALAAPQAAQATLVFVRESSRGSMNQVIWAAADDGSAASMVALGSGPRISPDGQTIAYLHVRPDSGYRSDLMLAPASGGTPPRRLMSGFRGTYNFAWSPDSSMIATVGGPESGAARLVLIDVASGARRTIATGFFSGVSFSPDGSQLVYGRSRWEGYPLRGDVFRADVAGGAPVRLTHDHRSLDPLWGPAVKPPECVLAAPPCLSPRGLEQIVFVKLLGMKRRRYGPKDELYLMGPGGEGVRRLTHTRVGPLLWGLTPTDWSADGTRLLAAFGGQDTSYSVRVDPMTGAQGPIVKATERGFVGTALSADGSTILGSTGGFEPGRGHDVVTVPYSGGRPTVLAHNAYEPDWSR